MKNDHNYGYFADLSQPNWTGRTLRESVGGEYARQYSASKRIPPVAYAVAVIVVAVIVLANFI